MKRLITVFILALITFSVNAQNEGEITGVIKDKISQEPVPNVRMKLTQNDVKVMEILSEVSGEFTFKPLMPGVYDVVVMAYGYDTITYRGLIVEPRGLNFQVFEIEEGVLLSDILIKPSLIDAGNPETGLTISGGDLRNRAVDNALEGAAQAPAVQLSERTGGISIGGSREDATMYVIDGVKVIGSVYVPMNAIKEINVITGGIPAAYGDFTGGIIEITTMGFTGAY